MQTSRGLAFTSTSILFSRTNRLTRKRVRYELCNICQTRTLMVVSKPRFDFPSGLNGNFYIACSEGMPTLEETGSSVATTTGTINLFEIW